PSDALAVPSVERLGAVAASGFDRPLAPGDGHGGRRPVTVAPRVLGPVLEPGDEPSELPDGFFIDDTALLRGGPPRPAQHAGRGVAAGPGDDRGGPGAEEVHPHKRVVFLVERDRPAVDLVLAHVVAVEIEVQRRLQLAGVRASAGELALPPPWQ